MNHLRLHQAPSEPSQSLAGLDMIRAFAAIAVVLLHACVPYLAHPMPGLSWPVADQISPWADTMFWTIEVFIMPLFLLLSGFFAYRSFERTNIKRLIQSRAKRLLIPLLFAVIVVLPFELHLWVLGWVADGLVAPIKLRSFKFDGVIDRDLWGLGHLWFLVYLFSYISIFAAVASISSQWKKTSVFQIKGLRLQHCVYVVLALGTLTLAVCPEVIWGFQHAFLPVPSKWLYNGLFFALGLALAKFDPQTLQIQKQSTHWTLLATCTIVPTVLLGIWSLDAAISSDDVQSASSIPARIVLAGLTTASSLTVSLALISMTLKYIRHIPPAIGYLAAASFWIYLVHHPIVALVHLDLKWWSPSEITPTTKIIIATGVSLGISLATYQWLVLGTPLGRWLGMAPEQRPAMDHPTPAMGLQDRLGSDIKPHAGSHANSTDVISPLERLFGKNQPYPTHGADGVQRQAA